MGLTRLAIVRPILIFMVMAAIIIGGFRAFSSMRKELNPDVSFGVVTVTTIYPGAGPEEVNTLITRPIEDAVTGVANIQSVQSSSQEGVSSVTVNFNIGTNMDAALSEVRTKVDAIVGELPQDVEKPIVDKFDTSSSPVLTMAVSSDRLSNRELRDLAENTLSDVFSRINGVASVNVSGGDLREIQVQLRRDDLLRYGVGIADIQNAVRGGTINVPAGRLVEGTKEYTVRVQGEFQTVDQLREMFITVSDPQQPGVNKTFQLKDVADVQDATTERRGYSRLNGSESVLMTVQKTKEGNAVEISDAIQKPQFGPTSLLQNLETQYGLNFVISLDTSIQINESLFDVQFALFFGIMLVALVIFLFLHNLRGTIIVAIAIPICLLATLIAYWAFGFTLNNMTMLAMSLAIGVLVDDAIVVLENIYRHLTMGEEPVEAAINGRSEIGLAAIAITMADVVVFVPVAFMGGVVGQFFRPLGIGYAVAVLCSLLVSFTITPMLASRWYRKGEDWEEPKGRFAHAFEKMFHGFANRYRSVLRTSLKHRWYFFGGGFAALFAMFMFIGGSFAQNVGGAMETGMGLVMMTAILGAVILLFHLVFHKNFKLGVLIGTAVFGALFLAAPMAGFTFRQWKKEDVFKFGFFPPSDSGVVTINVEMPPGTSLTETGKVVERLEKVAMDHPQAEYVTAEVGRRGGGFGAAFQGTQFGQITVTLREKEALLDKIFFWVHHEEEMRPMSITADQVSAELLQEIGRVPGANVVVSAQSAEGFGAPIQLGLQSDDRELLAETAKNIRDRLAAGDVPGVINVDVTSKPGKPELQAIPNRARMAEANVTTTELGAALRTLYEGDNSTKFRERGEEYDIRVMMALEDRNDINLINQVPIAYRQSTPIFLSEIADVQEGQSVDKIDRRDRQEIITVTADLLDGYEAGNMEAQIVEWMNRENLLPEGVIYQRQGQADFQNREMIYLFSALFTGLVLVYMVLASLFNNLLYPFIIQLSQPQALIGALMALVITDKTFNLVGFIGIIALVGLVGKNAILLVDYTNTLRARGYERDEALVESGGTRIRPILMTTIALIAGMLPVALAIGRGSEFRETIGITIIGGTLVSTILTLLVIPCSYSIFDDISNFFTGLRRKDTVDPEVVVSD